MKTLKIWYDDLCEDAKNIFLEFHDVENESELNIDMHPIAIIEQEEDYE